MADVFVFQSLSEALGKKLLNLSTDTIKVYLTNTAPSVSLDAVKADLPAEISGGNGYTTGGLTASCTYSRAGATSTLALASNLVLTASGSVGPFRYAVFYSDTASADDLIGFIDHGVSITMANTDTYTIGAGTIFTFPIGV